MGQRANLIIVRNNYYELYYSHWCANTLPKDLFWGEQHAVKFIEMQKQVEESGWLDDEKVLPDNCNSRTLTKIN
ncbi:hypothetical protein P4H94_06290 [Paenibacillus macerans]|uniref:hypothetical protein n=1 Tax=Paenibacillus TaxID=44249 RepID=UPI00097A9B87|nr:hypothetical protein [Paenibacillus macerans]MBS5909822.1 hypothetical protein [Paenibacillus macerans]MEC0136493.1 hypothetical protein [Paenibacillus macerans]OMG50486.1 hypothetical protein BK140_06060 [Paenibacillus macerans]GIP11396.1 hypothetical protein J1TS5_35660 [Paenibacillus macerans]